MTCKECKYWNPNQYPRMERDEYAECNHPKLDIDGVGYIQAGGQDVYGDYFHTSAKFGCVLFEL